jgi:ribose-phosphate pyrophosphokinase
MTLKLYEMHKKQYGFDLWTAQHKVFQFPGGESHVAFEKFKTSTQVAFLQNGSGDDLMSLAMWADGVKRAGHTTIAAIPYLPGARMDRGAPLGAKVYADIINGMGIDNLVALDPHSDVAPALYDNLTVVGLDELSFWSLQTENWDGVIVPDLGARKRAESVAEALGVPVIQAQKHRDFETGKLSGFSCEHLPAKERFLIVDDICDGGGTFIGLADYLKEEQDIVPEQLGLWVTHGIFSQGLDELIKRFKYIYTTNSHSGTDRFLGDRVRVIQILNQLIKATPKGH